MLFKVIQAFKVTDIGTSPKPVCDFLFVGNTNVSLLLQISLLVNCSLSTGVYYTVYNILTLLPGEPLNSWTTKYHVKKLSIYHTM